MSVHLIGTYSHFRVVLADGSSHLVVTEPDGGEKQVYAATSWVAGAPVGLHPIGRLGQTWRGSELEQLVAAWADSSDEHRADTIALEAAAEAIASVAPAARQAAATETVTIGPVPPPASCPACGADLIPVAAEGSSADKHPRYCCVASDCAIFELRLKGFELLAELNRPDNAASDPEAWSRSTGQVPGTNPEITKQVEDCNRAIATELSWCDGGPACECPDCNPPEIPCPSCDGTGGRECRATEATGGECWQECPDCAGQGTVTV